MKVLAGWYWKKIGMPPEITEQELCVKVQKLDLISSTDVDMSKLVVNPTVFITGDAACLSADCTDFESWNIPHYLYACNRSLIFHKRQVDHWCSLDVEESIWFTGYLNSNIENKKRIIRHTIGEGSLAYDMYWQASKEFESKWQKMVFIANSGFFGVLTALQMGYQKIILGGMPLDNTPHYYDPPDAPGPEWLGTTYQNWMDFKIEHPQADCVRSMGGYSALILGTATKEWAR